MSDIMSRATYLAYGFWWIEFHSNMICLFLGFNQRFDLKRVLMWNIIYSKSVTKEIGILIYIKSRFNYIWFTQDSKLALWIFFLLALYGNQQFSCENPTEILCWMLLLFKEVFFLLWTLRPCILNLDIS